ncbi:hypothetical protein LEP1GSC059_4206 [Leptospira noguchii serovar Panama str. CZ214]|uniref:Uncharacterized protein n=1 Tax=Leptospira noguchii serovar Panama str. CZ214 TaxID=1001595 RepID=T0FAM3_9LEPT|nr:hypothetical protein LEP1GSC059_4206 [Leptospira noguchii serovar Panama str. CZ214]
MCGTISINYNFRIFNFVKILQNQIPKISLDSGTIKSSAIFIYLLDLYFLNIHLNKCVFT